jgi:hypothetical protein
MKRLRKFLNALGFFKLKEELPFHIVDSEKIVRSIFSPINITNDNRLKSNAFRPQAGSSDISVNRLSYCSVHFCKSLSKKSQSPTNDRNYFGLALLYKVEIDQCNCEIFYTPKEDNKYHADINIGYKPVRGKPLPSNVGYKIKQLTEKSRLFIDPFPDSDFWEGEDIE